VTITTSHAEAAEILASRDPVLADLIAAAGRFASAGAGHPFRRSRRSDRLPAARRCGGEGHPRPVGRRTERRRRARALLSLSDETLRGRAVRQQGSLASRPRGESARRDGRPGAAAAVALPRRGRHRGPLDRSRHRTWTAQMFLMFQLRRLDVWPVGDFGVRQATALSGRSDADRARARALGDPYRPYRTVVAGTAGALSSSTRVRLTARSPLASSTRKAATRERIRSRSDRVIDPGRLDHR